MPQRFLRPGIRTSPRWNSISHAAARLYVSILTQVDDWGRYDGRNSILWSDAFAIWNEQNPQLAVNPQESAALCGELSASQLVMFYESDGRKYLQVTQWQERTRGKSKWPEPPADIPQESAGIRSELPKNAASLVPSHEPSPSPSPSPSVREPEVYEFLKERLNKIYKREPEFGWHYAEESGLSEISKRHEVKKEMSRLEVFQSAEPKYFPQSVLSLIEGWNATLDRAKKATPKRSSIEGSFVPYGAGGNF